jgi:predicted CXXCH cytochrome family protein
MKTRIMLKSSSSVRGLFKQSILALPGILAVFLSLLPARGESIIDSKHNLSATGRGDVRAVSETRVCVFCHTPHVGRDAAPLWNRRDTTVAYLPYNSPTLKARPGQPTGASKLCLSCHDGTIALGDLISEELTIPMSGDIVMPPGPGLIGTDLRDDHPISFSYIEAHAGSGGQLAAPDTWDPRVKLDAMGQLQCTSCHDPHDNQWGDFLVMDNEYSLLCQQCHTLAFFPQTPHAASTLGWNGAGRNPWPYTTYLHVDSNACLNCHFPHNAGGLYELLSDSREEEVCFVCHNGNVASFNLQAVFQKISTHPVDQYYGVHRAGESPLEASGHVECVDCHNPHRARRSTAQPPNVQGVLEGVTGIDAAGSPLTEAVYEYQVCFKCHAGESPPPLNVIPRQIPSTNLLRDFSPSSPSFHPVETSGRSSDVPSLIAPFTPSSLIYCTDCHNNDEAQDGLIGSKGPHGSNFDFLLAREYRTGDNVSESATAYALCYECHSRGSILADQSFPQHQKHIVEERAPCSVCHDPHGIDFGEGSPINNAHLINFDVSVVQADPQTGRLEYSSFGTHTGECYLRCHGENHSPKRY